MKMHLAEKIMKNKAHGEKIFNFRAKLAALKTLERLRSMTGKRATT